MQRFPFSGEFGQKIRKCSLHTGAPNFRHTNLVLFGAVDRKAFSCRQWFMDLRLLSLTSSQEMLAYCRSRVGNLRPAM